MAKGFNSSDLNAQALRAALGLKGRPRTCDQVKATIRHAVKAHLDPSRPYGRQKLENVIEVKSRISQAFPDIFEDPALDELARKKRATAAEYYVKKFFSSHRHTCNKNQSPIAKDEDAAEDQLPPPPATSLSLEVTTGNSTSSQQGGNATGPTPTSSFTSSASTLVLRPTSSIFSRTRGPYTRLPPSPSSYKHGTTADTTTQNTPLHPAPECRTDEIAAFLASCVPDMQFLLDSFVNFGCLNQEFLIGASKWSPSEIDELLNGLVVPVSETHTLGRLNAMDVLVLRKHIRSLDKDANAESQVIEIQDA